MAVFTGNTRWHTLLVVFCALLIALVLAGFTGRFLSVGDSLAILRPQAGALLLLCALAFVLLRSIRLALVSALFSALAFGSILGDLRGPSGDCDDTCLTLYQKNLLQKAWPRYSLADDIIASDADIVALQEVSAHNREYMANMFAFFPNRVFCQFRPDQHVVVLTQLPVVEGTEFCTEGSGLAGVKVIAPDGQEIWAVSVHLDWPFPFEQFEQTKEAVETIAALDAPVLIAGDFNMVPWGASVRRIAEAAGNELFGTIENTHYLGGTFLPLSIDNVLLPEGTQGTIELRPYMGSDHLGKLARFKLN
ncbi:endonuclease/exonuclease/phosphatase family protein [Ruegeria sp. HKCCD7255]|uniref:endonuclease/exonuclease/phosphatase family protein n=1 Tax=Ruegeria sp. HKCCD7255 TaxID=2683004 RepID=UPI00148925E6|nr:endonuclease/exonuclease/phosphatase family protein [Ruegeria sp. HKCCD7255]